MNIFRRLSQRLSHAIAGSSRQDGSPHTVLADIYWAFRGDTYSSLDEFENSVADYHKALNMQVNWHPAETVIEKPRVRVSYMCWKVDDQSEDDDQVDMVVDLAADNGQSFSAAELLFKLHNAVVNNLRDDDHQFFEGLRLLSPEKDTPPTYSMHLGS